MILSPLPSHADFVRWGEESAAIHAREKLAEDLARRALPNPKRRLAQANAKRARKISRRTSK